LTGESVYSKLARWYEINRRLKWLLRYLSMVQREPPA